MPLLHNMEDDFFINHLIQEGFSIEYWDLSNIFFPHINFSWEVERDYVTKIHNYAEIDDMILSQDINSCFFIVNITFSGLVIKLYRILTRYNCTLIYFDRTGLPPFSRNGSFLLMVFKNHRHYLRIEKIKKKFIDEIAIIYKKIGLIKNYDIVFAAGSVEELKYNSLSEVISINYFDYDSYLTVKYNTSRIIKNEYCVFLDDNIIYNTDFKMSNIKTVTETLYYKSLRAFFDRLENKYNLIVVIAAHPKADYKGNEFGNREIIKGKTNELVKDCNFAITHYSTSISFAILYKKPIIFIYTNELEDLIYCQTIKHYAHILGASIFNIDKIQSEDDLMQAKIINVNYSKYEDYKYKYLTSKLTENKLSSNIFLDYMNKFNLICDKSR